MFDDKSNVILNILSSFKLSVEFKTFLFHETKVTLSITILKHNDTQHKDTQHNDTQHNDTQHNDTQHNDTQHNDTQHNDTQH